MTDPLSVTVGAHERTLVLEPLAPQEHQVSLEGEAPLHVVLLGSGEPRVLSVDGRVVTLFSLGNGRYFEARSRKVVGVERSRARASSGTARAATGPAELRAPMPGRIVRVLAEEGAEILPGAGLVVIEAMKMENELAAPRAGVVRRVLVQAGDTVEHDSLLVEIA